MSNNKTSHFSKHLPDIMVKPDKRGIAINKVGISNVRLPFEVLEKGGTRQRTVGTVALHVALPANKKGTHMSRFQILLNTHIAEDHTLSSDDLLILTREMLHEMETTEATIDVSMDYFRSVRAPESKLVGVLPSQAFLAVTALKKAGSRVPKYEVVTGIRALGKTCCPCSREISDFDHETQSGKGAHAQRSIVTILVKNDPKHIVWFEDLIAIAEKSVSVPVYPVLKRVDERAVTMAAYNNPCFVEDVVRNVAAAVQKLAHVYSYAIKVENEESIHAHNAVAEIYGEIK